MQVCWRSFIVFFIALSLAGCGSVADKPEEQVTLHLLPPLSGEPRVLKQKIVLQVRDSEREFLLVSRLTSEIITAVVLLPTGQTLLQLQYDGHSFTQKAFLPADVPGKELLSIMQFSVWPEAVVRQFYNVSSGWHTEFKETSRSLAWKSQQLLQVDQFPNQLIVINYLHGYRVVINDLESDK